MQLPSFLHRWAFLIPAALASVVIFVSAWQVDFVFTPQVQAVSPATKEKTALDATIAFDFTRPVDRKALMPSITPDVEGEWIYENPVYGKHLFRALRFVPQHTLAPETIYTVELLNVQSASRLGEVQNVAYTFTTQPLPAIASITPADDVVDVAPTTTVTIVLDMPNPDVAEFSFALQPAVEFASTINESGDTYTLTFAEPLAQGTEHILSVGRIGVQRDIISHDVVLQGESVEVYRGSFTTAPPPNIASVSPTGDQVHVDSAVAITFSEAMDEASLKEHFSIVPDVAGTLALSDDASTLTFSPSTNLPYNTAYSVTIGAGAKTADAGFLDADSGYTFTTIGAARITNTSPGDGDIGVAVGNSISFTFTQEVDHASAEAHFSIEPSASGSFSWDGNTLHFVPAPALTRNVTYTARMAKGVKSVYGKDLEEDASMRFATESEVYKIAVAIDFQDKALSCEAAALKMALAAKGVAVSETDIMNIVGYDPTPHVGDTWGDPYLAYVGDISGKQNTTGYGVYWDPIAKAGNAWRPSEAFTGWSIAQLTQELSQGNPVVVWGVYGNAYEDSWSTPAGKNIYAWKGEHTRTAIGYVGSKESPTQIILNDPIAGQIYWSRSRFAQDWGIFGNAGVVVR